MIARLYLRASTKEQDAERALELLTYFCTERKIEISEKYIENFSGTKLNRPQLNQLLDDAIFWKLWLKMKAKFKRVNFEAVYHLLNITIWFERISENRLNYYKQIKRLLKFVSRHINQLKKHF